METFCFQFGDIVIASEIYLQCTTLDCSGYREFERRRNAPLFVLGSRRTKYGDVRVDGHLIDCPTAHLAYSGRVMVNESLLQLAYSGRVMVNESLLQLAEWSEEAQTWVRVPEQGEFR